MFSSTMYINMLHGQSPEHSWNSVCDFFMQRVLSFRHHSTILYYIVADRKRSSTHCPVTFRSVHTGIVPPFSRHFY